MNTTTIDQAISAAQAQFPETIRRLSGLVRIPSCSFPGFDPAHVERSAEATAAWMRETGFPQVEIVRMPGTHPYVLAEDRRAGADKPTVLLYAHHDVQPPMRAERWESPAFEPVERAGRLYGRGAADDKAGIALHAASAAAWYRTTGSLPVNVVVLVEGEEEIGSDHLGAFLDAHLGRLRADCLVIADLANFETGVPALTTTLRGLLAVEIELRALRKPLHSGVWGGAVPDPTLALCRLLAELADAQGRPTVPGLPAADPVPEAEAAGWASLPFDRVRFAEQAGLLRPEAAPDAGTVFRRLWREPSLQVNAIQAGTRGQTGNVIMDAAWARVGIRLAPGMDAQAAQEALLAFLSARAPKDMEISVHPDAAAPAWSTGTDHPLFALARQALERGYGCAPVVAGCGATIPFVGEMTSKLGGIPALLVGVEDPESAAHSENESVHLGDLLSAVRSQVAFLGLLAG